MEQKHRQCNDKLCNLIVKCVNIKTLSPYLFMNRIFNYDSSNSPQNSRQNKIFKNVLDVDSLQIESNNLSLTKHAL